MADRQKVYTQIDEERTWQTTKHGEFNSTLSPLDLDHIVFITEELGEAAQVLLDLRSLYRKRDKLSNEEFLQREADLLKAYNYELIQVAALAVQTLERLQELD